MLLSVDPGLRCAGVAEWTNAGKLRRAQAIYKNISDGPDQWAAMAHAIADWSSGWVDTVLIERMVTRKGKSAAHDDLIELSCVSGGVYALLADCRGEAVRPGEWTRSRPKRVNHRRVEKRLDDKESDVMVEARKRCLADNEKEVMDAIAIGLWYFDRLI